MYFSMSHYFIHSIGCQKRAAGTVRAIRENLNTSRPFSFISLRVIAEALLDSLEFHSDPDPTSALSLVIFRVPVPGNLGLMALHGWPSMTMVNLQTLYSYLRPISDPANTGNFSYFTMLPSIKPRP